MTTVKKYLKPNVVIEPLFENWYAWSHLISPATAAMLVKGRHLPIMNSYCAAPQIHAAAVKNPKMLGGPFMDFGGERLEEVKALRDNTVTNQQHLLELADAIHDLASMLTEHANGYSLEPLYEKVPECLKGYVELVYDLNHNPGFKIFESLLYHSKYYDPNLQSIALWLTDEDHRPFALSTPRLKEDHVLQLPIPFKSEIIDLLSRMKRTPGDPQQVLDLLDLSAEEEALFATFFTEVPPQPFEPYTGEKIRMRYLGHACILIETKDFSILVDPLISYYGYQSNVSRFSYEDLPEVIDYVLITHNHQDHIMFETMLPLRHRIRNLVIPRNGRGALQDPSLRLMFEHLGFKNIIELEEMETITFDDCQITGIPFVGEHADLDIRTKMCHHVRIGEATLLYVADSCNVESRLYEHVQRIVGNVDVVFLGMECDGAPLSWLYGPLLFQPLARDKDNSRRLSGSNYERGMSLIDIFNPGETYVYAMGQEPWLEYISSLRYTPESKPIIDSNKLVAECKKRGIHADRLFGERELFYDKDIRLTTD